MIKIIPQLNGFSSNVGISNTTPIPAPFPISLSEGGDLNIIPNMDRDYGEPDTYYGVTLGAGAGVGEGAGSEVHFGGSYGFTFFKINIFDELRKLSR